MSNLNQEYDKKKEQLKKGADELKDKGKDIAKTVRSKAKDVNKEALGFVREKPYIALASALVAGWVIAKILL